MERIENMDGKFNTEDLPEDPEETERSFDDSFFFSKDGELDKKWITNTWALVKNGGFNNNNLKPKDIEIFAFSQFLDNHLPFHEYLNKSLAFTQMMNRPDTDEKRQKVIDYLAEIVAGTLSADLRKEISKIHGLDAKIDQFLKNEIERSCYFMRENKKWTENINDQSSDKPEELKKFEAMAERDKDLKDEIVSELGKEGLF